MLIPKYGKREGWVPKSIEEFADGGAYPEIGVPQYPIKKSGTKTSKNLSLATFLPPKNNGAVDLASLDDETLKKPDPQELKDSIEATRAALQAIVTSKISAAIPSRCAEPTAPSSFIKYVPNSGSSNTKLIRMVSAQKDPCEPPKFRINKKIPQGPPSPPAPVLHSPPRKPTVKEQKDWKIPPCISNWKNPKGYTIPLDKRLAADGRGSQSAQINDKFASFAEALYIADRKAREGVELRAQLEKKQAQKEKEKKEENLKKLAQKAREERAGLKVSSASNDDAERDQIRKEKKKERQRENNLKRSAPHVRNEKHRDISEQIALNIANPNAISNEVSFDSRLMSQSRGIASGFGADDDYSVYDKPWRSESELGKGLYRPRGSAGDGDDDYSKITGKAFSGATKTTRDGPIPFTHSGKSTIQGHNEDIFGIDGFLQEAKKSTKRKHQD